MGSEARDSGRIRRELEAGCNVFTKKMWDSDYFHNVVYKVPIVTHS